MNDASSPARSSSITTRSPATPKARFTMILSMAERASSLVEQTSHALARGQSVGLDHYIVGCLFDE
jgi:hypothetical protein